MNEFDENFLFGFPPTLDGIFSIMSLIMCENELIIIILFIL